MCPYLPTKTDGSGDIENGEVHFKVVRGELKGPSLHRWDFGVLLPTRYLDNWPLPVALRVEGRQLESGVEETLHSWLEVEEVWGGGL